MKNLVKLLALSAVVLLTTLSLTACDNGGGGTHTHTWGDWTQTTAPTCTDAGVETRTCTQDATHKETRAGTAALGHDYSTWTITSEGVEKRICTRDATHIGETRLTYNLGDTGPGGGKIFYLLQAGFTMTDNSQVCHYLEAAPADRPGTLAWASSAFIWPGAGGTGNWVDISGTGTAIGTGRKNTALILATDTNAPAAKACKDYSNGGKTDWFLPSLDELNQLYVNRTSVGNMEESSSYWSSSQGENNGRARFWDFSSGNQSTYGKNNALTVRAVRAF